MKSLGMLSGFFGQQPGTANYGKTKGGSLLMPWMWGDQQAAGILGMPANFWTGNGGFQAGGGNPGGSGGGGGVSPPPPPPVPWDYPDLLDAQYKTTNWFGK
jgi:hypothetical protein